MRGESRSRTRSTGSSTRGRSSSGGPRGRRKPLSLAIIPNMALRISTPMPQSGVVTLTEIYRASATAGPFTVIDVLNGDPPKDTKNRFVYDDYTGDISKFYRVVFYDASQVILADSGPFSPNTVGGSDLGILVRLDHNSGPQGTVVQDAMRYCAESGAGIPDVPIRIYRQADFDAFRTDLALATTRTDDQGRWAAPCFVEPGQTYAVLFFKEGMYGPDVVRVIV